MMMMMIIIIIIISLTKPKLLLRSEKSKLPCHGDPFLGNDRETNYTTAVTRQRPVNRENVFFLSRTPWTRNYPVTRPRPTHRKTQTHYKCTKTFMLQVGFETMIPVSKTLHALDRAATVIGPGSQ
jgi:hypothetical protein